MNQCKYREEAFKYFRSSIYGDLEKADRRQIIRDHRDFMHLLTPYLPRDRETNILEVGCGNGLLIMYLEKEGYQNIIGIDTNPEQVAHCRREGIFRIEQADVPKFVSEKSEEYDSIIGFDILEHFTKSEAFEFLNKAFHAMKPLGKIVLRVPNMANFFGARSRFMDITHEAGYTEHSLRQILSLAGFDCIRVIPAKLGYLIKRAASIFVSNALHKFLYVLVGVPKPRITSKNIVAIGQKPFNFNS